MEKLIKRIGTKAYKFHVDIHIKKLEIGVFGSQKCECLIIFKRGDHILKCKSPVPLKNKQAIFDEILSHQSTLYYNQKKKQYLEKPAQFDVVIIFNEQQKAGGYVKIDLASYPNKNIKQASEKLALEKCIDKYALIYFDIKIHKISEVEDLDNDNSFISAKPYQKPINNDKNKNTNKNILINKRKSKSESEDESEENGSENSQDQSGSGSDEESESGSESGSGSDSGSQRPKSANIKNNKINKLVNLTSLNKSKTNNFDKKKLANKPALLLDSKTDQSLKDDWFNSSTLGKSNQTINSDEQFGQNLQKLLKDSSSVNKSSTSAKDLKKEEKTTKKENDLFKFDKFEVDKKNNNEKNLMTPKLFEKAEDDETKFENDLQEFTTKRMKQLELKLTNKQKENEENLNVIKELENKLQKANDKTISLQKNLSEKERIIEKLMQNKNDNESIPFENEMNKKETPLLIKNYEKQISELKNELQVLKNSKSNETFSINNFDPEAIRDSLRDYKKIENKLSQQEKEIRNLLSENEELKSQIKSLSLIKGSLINQIDFKPNEKEITDLKKEIANKEKIIKDLENELNKEKCSNESQKEKDKTLNTKDYNDSPEMSKLLIENQNFQKQIKELKSKNSTNSKEPNSNKELDNLKIKISDLEEENNELTQEKTQWKSVITKTEYEKIKISDNLILKQREVEKLNEKVICLEENIQITKLKLADALNYAFESGDTEWVEMIEKIVCDTTEIN